MVFRTDYDQATALCERSLYIRDNILSKDHPHLAESLITLARIYSEQEKYEQAECLYLRGLEIRGKALGKDHPNIAFDLNYLAALYIEQRKYDQAQSLLEISLSIIDKTLGQEHPNIKDILINYDAVLYFKKLKQENFENNCVKEVDR